MSRQNKVNPGMYTQRGRLTQDDAARELTQAALGRIRSTPGSRSRRTDAAPRIEGPAVGAETSGDNADAGRRHAETQPASRATKPERRDEGRPAKSSKAKSKTGQAKDRKAKTAGKAKTGKAAKPAAKRTATKTERKAVLARNVGGGGATPRPAAKRRKS